MNDKLSGSLRCAGSVCCLPPNSSLRTANLTWPPAAQRIAVEEGPLLLTGGPWNNVVRMIPALVVNPAEVGAGLTAWNVTVDRALADA